MKSCYWYLVPIFCFLSSTANIKAHSGERNFLLPGATLEQAQQALDETLQNLADASQVVLVRKIKQPDQQVPQNLTKVTIQLETNCSFDRLVGFLTAIRSNEKFLRIEELSILSFRMQRDWVIRPSLKVSGFVDNAPDQPHAYAQNLDKLVDGAGALLFRRDQNLEILKDLADILQPGDVLTTYHNLNCTIEFSGLFPPSSSSDLMHKLEKSPYLKEMTSKGNVYQDAVTGRERASYSAKCEK